MTRQEALECLAESVCVDSTAGVDEENQSASVFGNVSVEALRVLGFNIPQEETK